MQSLSRRCISSLLTVAPLERRTLGFSKMARKITKEPVWELVPLLRDVDRHDRALHDILKRSGVSHDEWARWGPVVYAPSLECAIDLWHRNCTECKTPSWVVLALASHKIKSPSDAESVLYDLAFPLTSNVSPRPMDMSYALPLLILTTHTLAYFSLISLLRPLTSHLIDIPPHSHTYKSFHFNMLLQAISLFDRSRVASDVAVNVLKELENRRLTLWRDTERMLIRDNFCSPRLLDYFRRRGSFPESRELQRSEAWLRAYASLGKVQSSAYYLHAIRTHCLENGFTPPYTTEDVDIDKKHARGTAHRANTQYLRSMRHDRQSAFRYFHQLLKLDLTKSHQSSSPSPTPGSSNKSNIDIYDWTTALHAGACDRTLSASSLIDLFRATKERTRAYKPTRATYTVLIQGLLWRNTLDDAEKLWDEFVSEVVAVGGKSNAENEMRIDRKALCVGIDVLVQSGRAEEALYLLEEAAKRDIEEATTSSLPPMSPTPSSSSRSNPTRTSTSTYLQAHPIHVLFTALLRIRRPDAIFYIWTHLTSLYFVPPTNSMLRILLKAAMQASKMDGESFKGTMSWYIADNRLFKKQSGPIAPTITPYKVTELSECWTHESKSETSLTDRPETAGRPSVETGTDDQRPPREMLVAHLRSLLQSPTPPPVVGIWANRRSTEVARSIFRGMMFGNWPALGRATQPRAGGVTQARTKGSDSVFQELARVLTTHPGHFLPDIPTHLGTARPTMARSDLDEREQLGPPLPTVVPSESTLASYIELLGLSSHAEEIPEVLVWMRALGIVPKRETLAVALVFWMEVGLRGPVFEDGWGWVAGGSDATATATCAREGDVSRAEREAAVPKTEYGALRAWIWEWVGEEIAPREEDIYAGIKRVREMRDGQLGRHSGGRVVVGDQHN